MLPARPQLSDGSYSYWPADVLDLESPERSLSTTSESNQQTDLTGAKTSPS